MKKILVLIIALFASVSAYSQAVPAPKDVIGFTPGDDRKMASWNQTLEYFKKLDAASPRVTMTEMGKSTLGRPFVYAAISSPANLAKLSFYQDIQKKLADPRLIKSNDAVAKSLIKQGKTIVLITCGIHSTEVGSSMSSMLIAEKLARAEDETTKKILENTIILLVPSLNPDGVDIVNDWYQKTLGTPYEGTNPPELYHHYTDHDNNRDWYAFTQVETQLTVDKLHNAWHPQIVHDIHQQGANGARLFLPPYLPPVEPNVPKQIVEGFTELGNFIAEDLRAQGFKGITTDSTYDAWTPARAYSHYHAGVRILSESASARLASPIEVPFEQLRGDLGYDAKKESPNYRPLWNGGKWTIGDITKQMTAGAMSLLKHASENREKWLTRFYEIGKEAVRPRKKGELWGYRLKGGPSLDLAEILRRAGVEVEFTAPADKDDSFDLFVKMAQPYGGFAKAILENQKYPNLLDKEGHPIPPYDVTAHTLSLLTNVEAIPLTEPVRASRGPRMLLGPPASILPDVALYKSSIPSMDEGWTRYVFDKAVDGLTVQYKSLRDRDLRTGNFGSAKSILFPDEPPSMILNGYAKGSMPAEYTGGVGAEGVTQLKKYVENGGTLVFLNRASDFAIAQFKLPVRDVTDGLSRKDFFIPGSILRTEISQISVITRGVGEESIAWFENSPAFEVTGGNPGDVEILAKYPSDASKILLSGWALGQEKLAGKAALVSVKMGKGKIVLFGFRPQYRGQSWATFPLLFNALGK